jgi:hypothetical protein
MFSNRIFRTTPALDFLRGPLLTAYLRFEILVWAAIAGLSLLSLAGEALLPAPAEPGEPNFTPGLVGVFAFSLLMLVVFVAVWRFKKWGVVLLALWTVVMLAGTIATLLSPPIDWLALLALAGIVLARMVVLLFEIRPKWSYFENGVM